MNLVTLVEDVRYNTTYCQSYVKVWRSEERKEGVASRLSETEWGAESERARVERIVIHEAKKGADSLCVISKNGPCAVHFLRMEIDRHYVLVPTYLAPCLWDVKLPDLDILNRMLRFSPFVRCTYLTDVIASWPVGPLFTREPDS